MFGRRALNWWLSLPTCECQAALRKVAETFRIDLAEYLVPDHVLYALLGAFGKRPKCSGT